MVKMVEYTAIFAGIDVSKSHLDVYCHPGGENARFVNDGKGWRRLCQWLSKAPPAGVVYEATGPYHKGMERYLDARGFAMARLDSRRARRFAEALGVSAKTDLVDARVLARFGAFLRPPPARPPTVELERLKELVAARRGLVQRRTRIANRSKTVVSAVIKRQLRQSAKQARRHIEELDAACRDIVKTSAPLARRFDILITIPAIGEVTAMTLLAEMTELGAISDKQIASLAGVAPMARDSGAFQGKRHIRGGRAKVRRALYMAALVATRFNHDMREKYNAMIKAGKAPKVAITAIMRKLIILANALIRDNRKWTKIRPCP